MNSLRARLLLLIVALAVCGLASLPAETAITLDVDATRAPQKIVHSHLVMPVKAGPLTLYYPKWIPGEHMASGPIGNVAALAFKAGGKTLAWRRDLLDAYTFNLDVPPGADRLEIDFDYIEAASGGFSSGNSASDKLLVISWNQNFFYPAGVAAEKITVRPSLRLPTGWKFGTALPVENAVGADVAFKPLSLDRLVDSPVVAGEYFRAVDITPANEAIHHEIDLVADSAAALEMTPEMQKGLTRMVTEALLLFGAPHYRDYHFLLTLSDHVAHFGLEHHESSDNRTGERDLLTPEGRHEVAGLLGHEFAHSWNGKYRRPADLSVPYFEAPIKTDLLWVYEGLTSYIGPLLAVRSGLWTQEEFREDLADTAAEMGEGRPGRTWRPLQDTADAEPGEPFDRGGWLNLARGVDYYPEGYLLWLEIATKIHDESGGTKSFEDFARAFFGDENRGPELKPYTFEELSNALFSIVPRSWTPYLHDRLSSLAPSAPLGGITAGGWKLDFTEKPQEFSESGRNAGTMNAIYSLGMRLDASGTVQDSLVTGLAYAAGITPGMRVMAVNDRVYAPELLKDALRLAVNPERPIRFLVLNDDYYKTIPVNYHGGAKYPHLTRVDGSINLLDEIAKPLAAQH